MAGSIFSSKTTDRHESPSGRMRKGSLVKGFEHLSMNAAKAAVRHEDDQIAVGVLAGNHIDDLIERGSIASALPGAREIGDELLSGEPLAFRQVCAEYGRDNHLVCRAERPREVLLKHATARGRRS